MKKRGRNIRGIFMYYQYLYCFSRLPGAERESGIKSIRLMKTVYSNLFTILTQMLRQKI